MFLTDISKDKVNCKFSGRYILHFCVQSKYHLKTTVTVTNSRFNWSCIVHLHFPWDPDMLLLSRFFSGIFLDLILVRTWTFCNIIKVYPLNIAESTPHAKYKQQFNFHVTWTALHTLEKPCKFDGHTQCLKQGLKKLHSSIKLMVPREAWWKKCI